MGIINAWFIYYSSLLSGFSFSKARLAFICLLFVIAFVLLYVYYYVSGSDGLVLALASSGAFLLPVLVYQSWIEMMEIPEKRYAAWHLPAPSVTTASGIAVPTASSMQVQLTVARRFNDDTDHSFPVTTSGKQKLGKVFEKFIEDQQVHGALSAIEIIDVYEKPFGWQFFEEKWFGLYRRNLNPVMNLLDNKLQANAKISVIRITDDPDH